VTGDLVMVSAAAAGLAVGLVWRVLGQVIEAFGLRR